MSMQAFCATSLESDDVKRHVKTVRSFSSFSCVRIVRISLLWLLQNIIVVKKSCLYRREKRRCMDLIGLASL